MAHMLTAAYQVKFGDELVGTGEKFSDDSKISAYAKEAVYSARALGIITGYSDNTFRPQEPATRAEVAKIIYEFAAQ